MSTEYTITRLDITRQPCTTGHQNNWFVFGYPIVIDGEIPQASHDEKHRIFFRVTIDETNAEHDISDYLSSDPELHKKGYAALCVYIDRELSKTIVRRPRENAE